MSNHPNQAKFTASADTSNGIINNNGSDANYGPTKTGWNSTADEKVLVHLDHFDIVNYLSKVPGVSASANKLPTSVKKAIRRALLVLDLRIVSENYVPTEEDKQNDENNNNNNNNNNNSGSSDNNNSTNNNNNNNNNSNASSGNNNTSGNNNNTATTKFTTTGPGSYRR